MPSGLVPNTNAFWLSLKVSKIRMTESVSASDASRRACDMMIFDGSASKQTKLTYTVFSANSSRTSVRSVAGSPSRGSCCVNVVCGTTDSHAASSTLPSMTGGVASGASRPGVTTVGAVVSCAETSPGQVRQRLSTAEAIHRNPSAVTTYLM